MTGRLIALEGIDGSGKGTQAKRLADRLIDSGRSAQLLSFPQYENTFFGKVIGEFLNGEFGNLDEVHPFFASLLYAGDRFESLGRLRAAMAESEFVVLDRYVASNLAHQVTRAPVDHQPDLLERIKHVEFQVFGLPQPELTIYLELPVPAAQQLIATKAARSYTDKAADLQESNAPYLERVRRGYQLLSDDDSWSRINCMSGESVRSVEEISDEIWSIVNSL